MKGPAHSPTLAILRAIGLAGFIAYVLSEALDNVSLSANAVVSAAIVVAVVIATLVAIQFFGKKLRRPK